MDGSSSEGMDLRVLLGEDIPSFEDDLFPYGGVETSEEEVVESGASFEEYACWAPFLHHSDGDTSEE